MDKTKFRPIGVENDKADNSVIAPVESGTTASQAYAAGAHFIRDGAFCTAKTTIAQGETFRLNTNYTVGTVGERINNLETQKELAKIIFPPGRIRIEGELVLTLDNKYVIYAYLPVPYALLNIACNEFRPSRQLSIIDTNPSVGGEGYYIVISTSNSQFNNYIGKPAIATLNISYK